MDSSALFSAMLCNYVQLSRRTSGYVPPSGVLKDPLDRNRSAQHEYLERLRQIPEKLITSHVIGELTGLITSRLDLKGARRIAFWRASLDLLTEWSVREHLVRVADLFEVDDLRGLVSEIGPADVGLIHLARLQNSTIITDDESTLAARAWSLGAECCLIAQLILADA